MGHVRKQEVNTGETVCAVLRDAKTGELRQTVEGKKSSAPVHTQRVEVIITDLVTGKVQRYEVNR